jgi:hypothetical protein
MGLRSFSLLVGRPRATAGINERRVAAVVALLVLIVSLMVPLISEGARENAHSTIGQALGGYPMAPEEQPRAAPPGRSAPPATNTFPNSNSEISGPVDDSRLSGSGQEVPNPSYFRPPGVVVSPGYGEVNSHVTVGGSFFDPFANYSVFWSMSDLVCTGDTNALGNFTCGFNVPPAVAGQHPVSAFEGNYTAQTTFNVDPSLMLSTAQGAAGSSIVATGAGYHGSNATSDVIFQMWWSQTLLLCTGNTTPMGNLSCAFKIPLVPFGSYPITVNDTADPVVTVFFTIPGPSHALPVWVVWSIGATIGVGAILAALFVAQLASRHWRGSNPLTRSPFSSSRRRRTGVKSARDSDRDSASGMTPESIFGSDANRPPPREGFSDPERPGVIFVRVRKRRSDLYPGEPIVPAEEGTSPPEDPPK